MRPHLGIAEQIRVRGQPTNFVRREIVPARWTGDLRVQQKSMGLERHGRIKPFKTKAIGCN